MSSGLSLLQAVEHERGQVECIFWQIISGNDFDIHVVARSFVTGRRYRSHCSASCSDVPKNLSHGMRQADDISNFVTDVTNMYNRMYLYFATSNC